MARVSKRLNLKETFELNKKQVYKSSISFEESYHLSKDIPLKNKVKIFCNAEETEYNYFSSFKREISKYKIGDISVEINKKKAGKSPKQLVEYAVENRDKSDKVWVVFDKDHFDIEEAISLSKKNNIDVAWSNECFELWFLYHFKEINRSIGRKECFDILDYEHKKKFNEEYKKNSKIHFKNFSTKIGIAKARALKQWQIHKSENKKFNDANPCTTIFALVKCLEKYIVK